MRSKDVELAEKLGEKSKEYYSLNNINITDFGEMDFAKKSKFHGQIMEDGYVFNPHIHRRWLPARYKYMLDLFENYGLPIDGIIQDKYDRLYSIDVTLEEMKKLDFLRKVDKDAFDERKRFFTVDVIKKVLLKELDNIIKYVSDLNNGCGSTDRYGKMYYSIYQFYTVPDNECEIESKLVRYGSSYESTNMIFPTGFLNKLYKRMNLLQSAETYYEISKAIKDIPIKLKTDYAPHRDYVDIRMSPYFVKAFHLAGAYYTLKNDIMFNHKEVNGLRGAEACAHIREMLNNNTTADDFDKILLG